MFRMNSVCLQSISSKSDQENWPRRNQSHQPWPMFLIVLKTNRSIHRVLSSEEFASKLQLLLPKNLTQPFERLREFGLPMEWKLPLIFRESDIIFRNTQLWWSEEEESRIFQESDITLSEVCWMRLELRTEREDEADTDPKNQKKAKNKIQVMQIIK